MHASGAPRGLCLAKSIGVSERRRLGRGSCRSSATTAFPGRHGNNWHRPRFCLRAQVSGWLALLLHGRDRSRYHAHRTFRPWAIDRGTMPIVRSDLRQTSFARTMHGYLAAYAENQHESRFGWKAFRVLTVTTDDHRMRSMRDPLRDIHAPNSPGGALFFFATRSALRTNDPPAHTWFDGNGRASRLL